MRKYLGLLLVLGMLASCSNNKKSSENAAAAAKIIKEVLGSFVGEFGDNKMRLLITRAEGDIVEGRTIVGGNDRPFSGKIKEDQGMWLIEAREPGDDPNDGAFYFSIQSDKLDVVKGVWKPFDKKKEQKEYELNRKDFKYNPEVGEYPEASQKELKPEDVENMMKSDLEWMRNEIFARHGYCFKKKETRQLFENTEWYVPDNVDIRSRLTPIEVKNIALIKRYEKYADDYGDEFGR
jgi:hypothetical protein